MAELVSVLCSFFDGVQGVRRGSPCGWGPAVP
jgi:hypothetical protein